MPLIGLHSDLFLSFPFSVRTFSQCLSSPGEASCSGVFSPLRRRLRILNARAAQQRRGPTSFVRAAIESNLEVASGHQGKEGIRFPFLSGSAQDLLTEIAQTLDEELGPHLQDSRTPSDVRYFKSPEGNSEGSVVLRGGKDSKVDFVLESWLHATLPFGTLDIATLVIMLGTETDSPHFLFEFILNGPVLVVVLDHLPRKDLVLDSAYLKRFYEDTELDKVRQMFEKAPSSKTYLSPVLFVRSVVSPTAAVFRLDDNSQLEGGTLDNQIANVVHPGANKMLQVWLESFRSRGLPILSTDDMLKRDKEIKEKGVEVDLSANLPRIFGQEITSKIVAAFRAGE